MVFTQRWTPGPALCSMAEHGAVVARDAGAQSGGMMVGASVEVRESRPTRMPCYGLDTGSSGLVGSQ